MNKFVRRESGTERDIDPDREYRWWRITAYGFIAAMAIAEICVLWLAWN